MSVMCCGQSSGVSSVFVLSSDVAGLKANRLRSSQLEAVKSHKPLIYVKASC